MTFINGDAVSKIKNLGNDIDFVLFDLWKELYIPCFEAIKNKVIKGGILAADNMIFPEVSRDDANNYMENLRNSGLFAARLLNIGQGLDLAIRI